MTTNSQPESWTEIIDSRKNLLSLNLSEIWKYKDLLWLFVKRDFVTIYKQTILGPLWYFLQPALQAFMYYFIFSRLAGIPTDGIPPLLFYLIGITFWNYFSNCLNTTSTTFRDNQLLFGKVYFPRLITPLSIVISNLIKLGIQFLLFAGFLSYYLFFENGHNIHPNLYALLLPLCILIEGILALAMGMIITSLTTKYRDLVFLLKFGIQLLMYATPVIYPLSIADGTSKTILSLNPITSVMETIRYGLLGKGCFSWQGMVYSITTSLLLLLTGIIIFNKTEKNFMDTV